MSLKQPQREQLRASLRSRRAALCAEERAAASAKICRALLDSERYLAATSLAAYLPFGTEASPLAVIEDALAAHKIVSVPVVKQRHPPVMHFARLRSLLGLCENEFGILEPVPQADDLVAADQPDLVLVPLVAFDSHGNRLGMGGGFYDRCFSFVRAANPARRPLLCGFAFDCQRVPQLATREWDVPLDCVATESGITFFRSN